MFHYRIKIVIVTVFLSFFTPLVYATEVESLWGISKSDLIKKLKVDVYEIFKPSDKPQYKNRVIDFFTTMCSEEKSEIIILRIAGNPEIDYIFFNDKLFSVSEEWGEIDRNRAKGLIKSIETDYNGSQTAGSTDGLYSFRKNRTKVLIQKKDINSGSSRFRVFYYSMDLFNMLLREQQ